MLPYVVTIFAVAGLVGHVARPRRIRQAVHQVMTRPCPTIDWDALRALPRTRRSTHAYVPYSKFPVGVAAIVDDGRDHLRLQRRERLVRPDAVRRVRARVEPAHDRAAASSSPSPASTATADALMPCGRCRQLLFEHSAEGMLLETVSGIRRSTR